MACSRSWPAGLLFVGCVSACCALPVSGEPPEPSPAADGSCRLAAGFRNPPLSARPAAYWCWLNGTTDASQLTRELEQFKKQGLSEVYIFDVGARDPKGVIPAGPAFMGPESLKSIAHAVREAGRLGLEVGLVTSSSWNAGGPWVAPRHASMGLVRSQKAVEGPDEFSGVLPFPEIPRKSPRGPDGLPVFYRDVAVLAVPRGKRLPGHEFLLELAPPGRHTIHRVVLYNTRSEDPDRYGPLHLFAKDFRVSASGTTTDADAFREVVVGSLQPHTRAQRFNFQPVAARYVKLEILSGHNAGEDRVELGEFEVYSQGGENVAAAYHSDGSRTGANLLHCTSARNATGPWTAGNVHDGATSGPGGSWSSAGPPPPVIEEPASIVDLTDRVDRQGHLAWQVPPGKWIILRLGCTNTGQGLALPSPNSQGLAIDHFSPAAAEMHFRHLIDRLQAELGGLENTALKHLYLCSYELRGSTWTPDFLGEFRRRRGYEMTSYLPALFGSVVGSREITERFRYDFRKTLGDLLVDAFYRRAAEMCRRHGLQLCAEAGGPGPPLHQVPVDALKALGTLDVPRGEFWKDHNVWVVKETACAAHIYGKPLVDMEAFTSWRHWQDGPFELKPLADRALCGGTNHFTFHTSAHNPPGAGLPGWVYHAGTHINPKLVWWPKAKPFIDYLARCSYLLQQGLFVADVCYYYGDQGFNFVPPKHVDPSLGYGYDYDMTNAEVILTRMDVQGGRIVLPDGLSYELLVLPDREDIDWQVLQKLEELVRRGATVVGRKPVRSNGLTDYPGRDRKVRRLADRLWGPCDGSTAEEHGHGRGKVIWGRRLRRILQERGVGPDFRFRGRPDAELDFIHRRTPDADIYFVRNQRMRWEEVDCVFRVRGRTPELWLPDSGEIRRVHLFDTVEGGTRLPLRLPRAGSLFVVFRRQAPGSHGTSLRGDEGPVFPSRSAIPRDLPAVQVTSLNEEEVHLLAFRGGAYLLRTADGRRIRLALEPVPAPREIGGPWEVRFAEGRGAPPSKVFGELISWTEDPHSGVKHFSGIAGYHKEFEIPEELCGPGKELLLDLGRVWAVAEVWLNDQPLGILWKPPFRLPITNAARPGPNRLVVEVANTWSNRLVGDAQLPPGRRLCRTNITHALTWESPWRETPLLESGMMGPVRLLVGRKTVHRLPK